MAANRRGVRLCGAFQSGTCLAGNRQGRCTVDTRKVHQCAKRVAPSHGADKCNQPPAREPRRKGKGTGKGGKGRPQY